MIRFLYNRNTTGWKYFGHNSKNGSFYTRIFRMYTQEEDVAICDAVIIMSLCIQKVSKAQIRIRIWIVCKLDMRFASVHLSRPKTYKMHIILLLTYVLYSKCILPSNISNFVCSHEVQTSKFKKKIHNSLNE